MFFRRGSDQEKAVTQHELAGTRTQGVALVLESNLPEKVRAPGAVGAERCVSVVSASVD